MDRDIISRKYALAQVEMGLMQAMSKGNKVDAMTFISVKAFLKALPAISELDEHVYCTKCAHFNVRKNKIECPYENLCNLSNPEDSAPRKERLCYSSAKD